MLFFAQLDALVGAGCHLVPEDIAAAAHATLPAHIGVGRFSTNRRRCFVKVDVRYAHVLSW